MSVCGGGGAETEQIAGAVVEWGIFIPMMIIFRKQHSNGIVLQEELADVVVPRDKLYQCRRPQIR